MRNIKAEKIVVKVGTNTLTHSNGLLDSKVMENITSQVANLMKKGKKIILITSGAIGSGMQELGLKKKPEDIVMKQVCAGIGQSILMANYHSLFKKYDIKVAQILLTYKDFSDAKTLKNFTNSLDKMLELGVIPIINENDPISIDEIGASFGDNDNLSALIATTLKTDLLVILTNVDGLYDRNPTEKNAVLIKEVANIDKKIESFAGSASNLGLGGMQTKVAAAKMATKNGIKVVVANGKRDDVLSKIFNNEEIGTIFH